MKLLIVIATLVVSCTAMPATHDRPTPINPSVLSEPKPPETTTPIKDVTDEREPKPFYPTALPAEVSHHALKRDHKAGQQDSHPLAQTNVPELSPAPQPSTNSNSKHQAWSTSTVKLPEEKRTRRDVQKIDSSSISFQKPQTLPALIPLDDHRDDAKPKPQNPQTLLGTPLQDKEQHKRDAPQPLTTTREQTHDTPKPTSSEDKKQENKPIEASHNPNVQVEDLSEQKHNLKHPSSANKHPHDFHSQKPHVHPASEEQKPVTVGGDIQQKPNLSKVSSDNTASTTEHPLIRRKPVPVAELFSRHPEN